MLRKLRVRVGSRWYSVEVEDLTEYPIRALVDGDLVEVDVERLPSIDPSQPADVGAGFKPTPTGTEESPSVTRTPSATRVFRSPMPGVIVSVSVKEGDQIVTGDEVCILEAMKMHQVLRADWSGIIRAIHVGPGQQVLGGDPIVELE